ncbi:MAG: GAF domain-containing protein, partial [Raineya sp.]
MKSGTYRIFAIISTILFVLASAKVAYDFYTLSDVIVEKLEIVEIGQKRVLSNLILNSAIFFVVVFLVGFLAILLANIASSTRYAEAKLEIDTLMSEKEESNTEQKAQKTGIGLSALGEVNKILNEYTSEERLERLLALICNNLEACQGAVYLLKKEGRKSYYIFQTGYAYYIPESQVLQYEMGEGLVGQVGKDKNAILLKSVPEGYMQVISGLGQASPKSLLIVPVFSKDQQEVVAIFEIASFSTFTELQKSYVQQVAVLLNEKIEEDILQTINQ